MEAAVSSVGKRHYKSCHTSHLGKCGPDLSVILDEIISKGPFQVKYYYEF